MSSIFHDIKTEAVDANNALDLLSCKGPLHNISIIIMPLDSSDSNEHIRAPVRQFITGSGEILSMEGTIQGDPLAMAIYDLAIIPLIDQLKASCPEVHQIWYADDATGAPGADPGFLDGGFERAKRAENFWSPRPFYLSFSRG